MNPNEGRIVPMKGDIVIAVMGVTGAGKTSFIQHFFPHELSIGHDLESCTTRVDIMPARLSNGIKIFLVDTPGFDDTYKSDTDVLRELADWLSQAYKGRILLSGIVYMHRITDVRVGGSAMKNLRMFRKLCGDQGLGGVACVTTMWDLCSADDGERRERQLQQKNDLWKHLLDSGAKAFRHDAGKESAENILKYFVRRRRPVTLDIQEELVDQGLKLSQTGAGKEVQGDLDKLKEEHEKEIEEIRVEVEEAIREKDEERQKELTEYRKQIRQQMDKQEEEMRKLETGRDQLRREMQEQHEREIASIRSHMNTKDQEQPSNPSSNLVFVPIFYDPYPNLHAYERRRAQQRNDCVIL